LISKKQAGAGDANDWVKEAQLEDEIDIDHTDLQHP
jgi:hypothetical protein